jgi:hypothetical protein
VCASGKNFVAGPFAPPADQDRLANEYRASVARLCDIKFANAGVVGGAAMMLRKIEEEAVSR